MKTSKFLCLGMAALTLAACSNDDESLTNGPVEARISAGVNTPQTRANDAQWEQDEIGVMVTNAESSAMKELYKNVKYTTTANTETAANFTATTGQGIFFQDANETVTFAAYAPYQGSASNATLPGTNGVISGSTYDQSSREKQKAFDYIYASGATASRSNPRVEFKESNAFAHKMTSLLIYVKTSTEDGFTADQVTSGTYSLSGLKHDGTFDVKSGIAIANTAGETTDDWSLTDNSLNVGAGETVQVTFHSILYPQTLGSALTFKAVIDGKTYTNSTNINPGLAPGKVYFYSIPVKKTGLTVSGCTIDSWGIGTDERGEATMQ